MSTIHIAIIQHRFGDTKFAATTKKLLIHKLACYCREQWIEEIGAGTSMPKNDEECVNTYFEIASACQREFITIGVVELITEEDDEQ